jgi:uncharacterized membrane protein YphA (DoxX/SURF4 family)
MSNFITQLLRILVGAFFVFSGFVKLIDPLGSSYKFQEYFSEEVLNLEFLQGFSLEFSILLILAEIMLGIMLLVGYRSKFTTWGLFLLSLIFLFLTWYSAYYDKVKDCGCFGDFLKLSAWETFYKNVILIVLVAWLLIMSKQIRPLYSKKLSGFISILFFLGFSFTIYYVLHHLPLIDFRAYAVGKNIPEQMIYPENAKKAVIKTIWTYKIDGIDNEFSTEEKPWDIVGSDGKKAEYVDRKDKVIEEGYEPPIHDFTMERRGNDLTKQLMQEEKLMLIITYDLNKSDYDGFANIKIVTDKALNNGYTVFAMSNSDEDSFLQIKKDYNLDFDLLYCDETTLKTIVRSNPGIVTVNKGIIEGKWSYNDFEDVKIKEGMGRKITTINFDLKQDLDRIFFLDKKYRSVIDAENPLVRDSLIMAHEISRDSIDSDFWAKQIVLDSANIEFLDKIILEKGYPGKSLVGELSKDKAWSVIMHSNRIAKYVDIVKEAAENEELTYTKAAEMEDLYLMNKGEEQKYGTQTFYYNDKYYIWPIKDEESVNVRRKEAGFNLSVYQYAKTLFGDDYVYAPIKMEDIKK